MGRWDAEQAQVAAHLEPITQERAASQHANAVAGVVGKHELPNITGHFAAPGRAGAVLEPLRRIGPADPALDRIAPEPSNVSPQG
jgi:hypothetical protein